MPAIAIGQGHIFEVNKCKKEGDKFTGFTFAAGHIVDFTNDTSKGNFCGAKGVGVGADGASEGACHNGCGDAFSDYVCDSDDKGGMIYRLKIVDVSAYIEAGYISSGNIKARYRGGLLWNHSSLDGACEAHLLSDFLSFDGFGVEFGVSDGDGALGANGPRQSDVVFVEVFWFWAVETQDTDGFVSEFHSDGELAYEALFDCRIFVSDAAIDPHIVEDDRLAGEGGFYDGVIFIDGAFVSVFFAEAVGASHFEVAGFLVEKADRAGLDGGYSDGGLSQLV